MQAGVTCTSFLLTTQLESGNWKEENTATDDDTVIKLMTAVTSTFPKSGLTQFRKTYTSGSDQTRHTHTQMHEEMVQLTQKLIVWDDNDTTLTQSAIELDGIDRVRLYEGTLQ